MMTNYLRSQFRYQNIKLIFTVAYNYLDLVSIFQPQLMMSYCRHLCHTPQPAQKVKQISTKKLKGCKCNSILSYLLQN